MCATTDPARITARPERPSCSVTKSKAVTTANTPRWQAEHLVQGDLNPSMDFRGIYSTILDKWLKVNPVPIVNGSYEQQAFLN